MTYFIFGIYLLFFCWLIPRIPFIQKSGLKPSWLIALFILKILAGIAYGVFYTTIPDYKVKADTWKFFYDGCRETNFLFSDPLRFLTKTFENPYQRDYGHFFSDVNSYWSNLKHIYMVKIVSVFNVFSGSRYYVNVIFYSFLTFFGPIALLRMMKDLYPGKLKLLTLSIFLFPSFLFWSSGIHKDGIVFSLLTLAAYLFYFGLKNKKLGPGKLIQIAILLVFIFLVRNHVVLAAVPGFIAWWIAERYCSKKWVAFLATTVFFTTLFFTTKYIHPKLDLPISIVLRQKEFVKLGGSSFLPQRELHAEFTSFVKNAPQALNHTLVRPYITEIISPLYLISALEILFIWLLVFFWFFRYTTSPYKDSVVIFMALVSFTLLLLTGFIVPQLGAIVRYRSIFIPLLITPIIATIEWPKFILKFFKYK